MFSKGHRGPDHRASIRVPTELDCTFGVEPLSARASVRNLSRSGLFLSTDELVPIGSEVWVRIDLGGGATLELRGLVATRVGAPGAPGCGMGVHFSPMEPSLRKALDDLYQASIVRRFGEPTRGGDIDPLDLRELDGTHP